MFRSLFVAVVLCIVGAERASAQCGYYPYPLYYQPTIIYVPVYPIYAYPPNVWGAPAPKPLPPAPPPYVPKANVKEDEPTPPSKDSELPKIPKTNLLPEDKKVLPVPKPADPKEVPPAAKRNVDEFLIAGKDDKTPSKEVKIGFFNHSSNEITLEVNGEIVKLPSEQYVTLRLPRSFSWNVKGEKSRSVSVPNDAEGLEIVFRK